MSSKDGAALVVLTKRILFSTICTMVFSITACTSTKLTSVWKDTTYDGYIESILVVAVTENLRNRLIFESEFVEEFKKSWHRGPGKCRCNTTR